LFLCDVDGILTDALVHMGDGIELKSFDVRDGFGLRLLQRHGIQVGWISHRPSQPTTQRAEELGINFLHQAQGSKVAAAEKMIRETGLSWKETCFMGDDLVDLAALRRAGLAVTVPHALEEAQDCAHYTTRAHGGHGAVREVVELILKAQGKWQALVATYSE
jgi:3-deoxy-D-manno-octulosonate 8-phosphate phosphatase (KDO 8-P phosphatase)